MAEADVRRLDRKDSVSVVPGKEGEAIAAGSFGGTSIGVFTSGGDSQGLYYEMKVFITDCFTNVILYVRPHYRISWTLFFNVMLSCTSCTTKNYSKIS